MKNILTWFVPQELKFFDMLRKQSENVLYGAKQFKEFMFNYSKLSDKQKKEFVNKLKDIENHGDDITHSIIEALNKTFVTPFDREDIHQITVLLDDVIDFIDVICRRIYIYKLKEVSESMKHMTSIIYKCVVEVNEGVKDLRTLKNIKPHCIKINTLENEADYIHTQSLAELFNENHKKNPIEVMKTKEIQEYLENVVDKCEAISFLFDNIVVKHG